MIILTWQSPSWLVPFKEDAVPVGKVKNTWDSGQLGIRFDLLDDPVWHGVRRKRALFNFLSRCQAEKLVSPLQVFCGVKHYRCGRASYHGVRGRWLIMNLTVRPKQELEVLCKVQLVLVHNFMQG